MAAFAAGLAAVASAPSSSTLLPQTEQTQPHVGVCVVGEAREFAVPSVRAGLRKFLSTLNNPVVHMKLFRQGTSSCAGSNTRMDHNVCARMEAQRFNMSSSDCVRVPRRRRSSPRTLPRARRPRSRSTCCRPTATSPPLPTVSARGQAVRLQSRASAGRISHNDTIVREASSTRIRLSHGRYSASRFILPHSRWRPQLPPDAQRRVRRDQANPPAEEQRTWSIPASCGPSPATG